MTVVYNKPEAKVLMRREPKKVPFWRRIKNFFSKVFRRGAEETANAVKFVGKCVELVVRITLINPLGQLLLAIIAMYFTIWVLNILYMYIGGLAFIAIVPVIMVFVGIQIAVMALNEDTVRKAMKQKRERSYA
jgi:ABC-type bacteriocin/lantibiotic exporter with double-glycine peptidase domain